MSRYKNNNELKDDTSNLSVCCFIAHLKSKNKGNSRFFNHGKALIITLSCFFLQVLTMNPLRAETFNYGEFSGYYNLDLSYGLRFRLEDQDKDVIGVTNGGKYNVNQDNGNLNYDKGIVSNIVMARPALGFSWGHIGAYIDGYAFYDYENDHNDREHVPLGKTADNQVSKDADILSAYLSLNFTDWAIPTRFRVGKQKVSWGESVFVKGIDAINPPNVPLFTRPGATAEEFSQPAGMIWALAQVTPLLSVEAFWQYDWEGVQIPAAGTYLSTLDTVSPGNDGYNEIQWPLLATPYDRGPTDIMQLLSPAASSEATQFTRKTDANGKPIPFDSTLLYEEYSGWYSFPVRNQKPDDGDEWGITLRAIIPQLNDTNFSLYYMNYTSRYPILRGNSPDYNSVKGGGADALYKDIKIPSGITGYDEENVARVTEELIRTTNCETEVGLGRCQLAALQSLQHWATRQPSVLLGVTYPEDVELFGLSFNTTTIKTGTAFSGELVYNKDLPMPVHLSQSLWSIAPPVPGWETQADGSLQVADPRAAEPGEDPYGYRDGTRSDDYVVRGDTIQATLSAVQILPQGFMHADSWSAGLELSYYHILDFPEQKSQAFVQPHLQLPREDRTLIGVPGTQFAEEDPSVYAFADERSYGYRFFTTGSYNGVLGGLQLRPRLIFMHDVHGYAPSGRPFIQDRKTMILGLTTSFLKTLSVDASYRSSWGGEPNNLLSDRDYIDIVFRAEF